MILTLAIVGGVLAQDRSSWTQPLAPYHIVGNVYYVGTRGLASYLITTPKGHILINTNTEETAPLIRESVEKLGFRFEDVKIILISHAHWDHCGGSALIKELTGAKYFVMEGDASVVESGGKDDYHYRNTPSSYFKPTKVDRVLHDGDEVKLGGTVLVAHRTPGHTKGCTTWSMKAREGKETYNVVIVGGPNANPNYQLLNNPLYPEIVEDYEKMFRLLKSLPCDVILGAHGDYFGMDAKLEQMKEGQPNPFIDPDGYKSFIADREQSFRSDLEKQKAAAK